MWSKSVSTADLREGAGMSEKKPLAGEWWEYNGVRIYIIGLTTIELLCCEYQDGAMSVLRQGDYWKYLPECDSFEWKPETFPQWYAKCCGSPYADCDYIIRTSKTTLCGVLADGTKTKEVPWGKYHEEFVIEGSWVPLTQAEAEARIKKPELLSLMNCQDCGEFRGHGHEEICKAKTKPNYVRIWTHRTSGTVCSATDERYLKYPDIWTELKHDGTGFYLAADGK